MFCKLKDYEYFEIDASKVEKDVMIEFGYSKSRDDTINRMILGRWNGEKTRLSHYNLKDDLHYNIQYREHTKEEWEKFRLKIYLCGDFN